MKRFIPLAALVIGLVTIAASLIPKGNKTDFDVVGFGRLPVLLHGRVQPYDHVARTVLIAIQGRQRVVTPRGTSLTPSEWLLDVVFKPELANKYQIFLIDNPDILTLFNLRRDDGLTGRGMFGESGRRFSYDQLLPGFSDFDKQKTLAGDTPQENRTLFQKAVVQLYTNIYLYQRLEHTFVPPTSGDFLTDLLTFEKEGAAQVAAVRARTAGQPADEAAVQKLMALGNSFLEMQDYGYLLSVPPASAATPDDWHTMGDTLREGLSAGTVSPTALVFAGLARTWRLGQPEQFNGLLLRYRTSILEKTIPDQLRKVAVETRFDSAAPFFSGTLLCVGAFLLGVFAWLGWPASFGRASSYLLGLAWILCTAGIAVRMWMEGRPPVTNLYSSALYIGWGCVGLCLILESLYRNSIASVAGAVTGFCTLLIAHFLSLNGDTLEMMRAVLDSNFWLATHVLAVTTGYAATFLAGFLALIYVFRGLFTTSLDAATAASLNRMVYGVLCFATLFSFVGTVLGGIWADQSWGRFWGWDPKENGALIIVLWNAIILHCRWGGMIKQRGLMCLAIVGNIVTSWSWFGVNMLGVGLHNYGFTDAAFFWLSVFILSQLAIIAAANTPLTKWRSFQAKSKTS